MARRRTSTFDDWVKLASRLPWWIAVILAVASYFGIHHFAVMEVQAPKDIQSLGQMITGQMIKTFAVFGQYLVPVAFSLGAVVSVIGRRKRANLYQRVGGQRGKNALNGISWREFERLVGEWFRRQGYAVRETGGAADGGVDLVLVRESETYLVQCKQWKAIKVGVNIVREILGVMAARGAAGGFLVTSGVFTGDACRFASAG